jgi:hypothetical protein
VQFLSPGAHVVPIPAGAIPVPTATPVEAGPETAMEGERIDRELTEAAGPLVEEAAPAAASDRHE